MGKLPQPPKTVLIVDDGTGGPRVEEEQPVPVLYWKLLNAGPAGASPQGVFDAYHTIFGLSGKIGARVCGVIVSELRSITPEWVEHLVRPAFEMNFDLVAPRYARHKWEGLLNRSILAPLHRALYG